MYRDTLTHSFIEVSIRSRPPLAIFKDTPVSFKDTSIPLWRAVSTDSKQPVLIVQARDELQAGVRVIALLALCHGAFWLEGIKDGGALSVEPHGPGEPLTVPSFGEGWFTILDEYVESTFNPSPH